MEISIPNQYFFLYSDSIFSNEGDNIAVRIKLFVLGSDLIGSP